MTCSCVPVWLRASCRPARRWWPGRCSPPACAGSTSWSSWSPPSPPPGKTQTSGLKTQTSGLKTQTSGLKTQTSGLKLNALFWIHFYLFGNLYTCTLILLHYVFILCFCNHEMNIKIIVLHIIMGHFFLMYNMQSSNSLWLIRICF